MVRFSVILILLSSCFHAQDKLFFTNGSKWEGLVVSITQDLVFYKATDTSTIQKIAIENLLLIEKKNGTRYVFSGTKTESLPELLKNKIDKKNIFSAQPIGVLVGRATVTYERLTDDGTIGYVIPFSITFDPTATFYKSFVDTSQGAPQPIQGVSYITGIDVNFYFGKKKSTRFFMGPRFRYGTDLFLGEVEGYSLQTQLGWKLWEAQSKLVQHFSFGFGFARVLSSPGGNAIDPEQSYVWGSINYRVGFRW